MPPGKKGSTVWDAALRDRREPVFSREGSDGCSGATYARPRWRWVQVLAQLSATTFGSASLAALRRTSVRLGLAPSNPRVFWTESVLAQGPNCTERLGYSSYPQRRADYITRDFSQSTRFWCPEGHLGN